MREILIFDWVKKRNARGVRCGLVSKSLAGCEGSEGSGGREKAVPMPSGAVRVVSSGGPRLILLCPHSASRHGVPPFLIAGSTGANGHAAV